MEYQIGRIKVKNLHAALLKAQKSVDGVQKKSTNKFSNYDYVSAEDMVVSARRALLGAGLVAGRKAWEYANNRVYCTYFVSHPESGEEMFGATQFPVVERKGTPNDKAVATALTSSLSYFLRDILLLPRFSKSENMDFYNDGPHVSMDEIQNKIFRKGEKNA